ncbi:MAG: alpha/beta fold hydrolase [Candidatus Saccharimonadales bacterium]
MTSNNEPTFGLVHGSWHGAWCWDFLQSELDTRGIQSVAMDLPIEDPTANFEDYADVVVDALKHEANIVLVGHSRAGNVIPRAAGRLATTKLIYLCSSFEPATIEHFNDLAHTVAPPRNSERFQQGIIDQGNGLTIFDQHVAKELFFNDCSPDIQEWATKQLRPQKRTPNEPSIREWPAVPQEYIICTGDRVVNPEWSKYVAHNWLGIETTELQSGHSPFLSKPAQLASMLISLAQ